MGEPCESLTFAEITIANRLFTEKYGGQHGFRTPGSLEFMLEQVQGTLFGEELYPGIVRKAAFICHRLARGHIFIDANKRTAFWACKAFLKLNGYTITFNTTEVVDFMISIAKDEQGVEEVETWLRGMLVRERTSNTSFTTR